MSTPAISAPDPTALPAAADSFAGFRHIPTAVTVEVSVVGLTVRELYRLEVGSIVTTAQPSGANVPVQAAKALLAWGEFQVFGDKLAVRLAELV